MGQKTKSYGQALVTAVIIILIFVSVPFLNSYLGKQRIKTTDPKQLYAIENASPEFELLWTKNSFSAPVISMIADSEQAYVLSDDGSVIIINLQNGAEDQFIRARYSAIPVPRASTIGMNSEMLYVGFDKTQKIDGDMRWGAGKIEAFNRMSGAKEWSQVIPGASTFSSLIITEDKINIDGDFSNKYHLLDAETGEILQSEPKIESSFVWHIEDNFVYEKTKDAAFQLRNQEQEKILWQSESWTVSNPPIFTLNRIIFKSGRRIVALDKVNGQIVWEYPNDNRRDYLYSNITYFGDSVFFATENGTLFAVDAESGDKVSSIQFTPQPTREPYTDVFQVAADKNIILVYTGSTEQLFAFRLLDSKE